MSEKKLIIEGDPDKRFPIPVESQFETAIDGGSEFLDCEELTKLGRALMELAQFDHLDRYRVVFLWKMKGGNRNGKANLGKCQKPTGLLHYYSNVDLIIWLAADHLARARATYFQIEAILFHELKHTDIKVSMDDDGEDKLVLVGHDWEGFTDEIKRYGAYMDDIERVIEISQKARSYPLLDLAEKRAEGEAAIKPS